MKGHHQGEECQHVIRGLFHGKLLIMCLLGPGTFFFQNNVGVRQGCIISLTLFNIFSNGL